MNAALKQRILEALRRLEVMAEDGALGSPVAHEAAELAEELEREPCAEPQQHADPRIRLQRGDYRVVAPAGRKAGTGSWKHTFYVNGRLVIEKRGTDSLGAEVWTPLETFELSGARDGTGDARRALFVLLAGECADKDLR
jgi:hypothetical protein